MAWIIDELWNIPDVKNGFQALTKLGSKIGYSIFSAHVLLEEPSEKQVVKHHSRLAIAQTCKLHDPVQVLRRSANLQYCGSNLNS